MIVSKRKDLKKKYVQKIVFLTLGALVLSVTVGGMGVYFGFIDGISAKNLVSPVSTVAQQGVFGVFSHNPQEEIKNALQKANIPFEQIYSASNSAYVIRQKDGQEIILTSGKDIQLQVATLQLILSRITIEGKSLSRVDLRFDKPVVAFK